MTTIATAYPKVGDPSPNFTLPSLDGQEISLSSYKGKKMIVFMWASW